MYTGIKSTPNDGRLHEQSGYHHLRARAAGTMAFGCPSAKRASWICEWWFLIASRSERQNRWRVRRSDHDAGPFVSHLTDDLYRPKIFLMRPSAEAQAARWLERGGIQRVASSHQANRSDRVIDRCIINSIKGHENIILDIICFYWIYLSIHNCKYMYSRQGQERTKS